MATAKFKWKVEEAPTGPYSSFRFRGWPSAVYKNERQDICGDIQCKEDYTPFRAKSGKHAPLTVRVCDHSTSPFKWLTLTVRCATLADAKAALAAFIDGHPEVMPVEYHQERLLLRFERNATVSNRVINVDVARAEHAVFEAKCASTMATGQKLLARIRPSSKYYGQGDEGLLFPVAIASPEEYGVVGGSGGQYRLNDVDLFAVFAEDAEPIQITFAR